MVSFESELLLGRFRARGVRLFLPTVALCAAGFTLSFGYGRLEPGWQQYALFVVVGLVALFGFVIPVLRYLTAWTDVTTARVVSRSGLWGQRYRSVSLAGVERVEYLAGGIITLYISGEAALDIRGLPKPKLVAQEISNLVAKSNPSARVGGV